MAPLQSGACLSTRLFTLFMLVMFECTAVWSAQFSSISQPHRLTTGCSSKSSSRSFLTHVNANYRHNWRKWWFMLNGEKLVYLGSHMELMVKVLSNDTFMLHAGERGSCSEVMWAAAWICGEYCGCILQIH
ncbi:hypothetical protein EDB19DRAFT_2035926 [Suillus lakei]|nr:hypothetical protein EDB19DRAFT_2035926 [Suillus lakei]